MHQVPFGWFAVLALLTLHVAGSRGSQAVDIQSVQADLHVPPCSDTAASPGIRIKQVHPDWANTSVYHTLYLPENHHSGTSFPVMVELPGNGGFRSRFGDVCTGLPEGCKLGYGLSAGKDLIWVSAPFVSGDGTRIARTWWGDAPAYDPAPTIRYLKKLVPWVCDQYGGDPRRVILAGFSRGAIACNFIGLHDDEIAGLWCGMVVYSHYDGVRSWPFSEHDHQSALSRLKRLGKRPQFICHEGNGITATKQWLASAGYDGDFTFAATGFRNHNDAWTLRPSPARKQLRSWLAELIAR